METPDIGATVDGCNPAPSNKTPKWKEIKPQKAKMKGDKATKGTKWKGMKLQKAKTKGNETTKGKTWKEIKPQKVKNEEKWSHKEAKMKGDEAAKCQNERKWSHKRPNMKRNEATKKPKWKQMKAHNTKMKEDKGTQSRHESKWSQETSFGPSPQYAGYCQPFQITCPIAFSFLTAISSILCVTIYTAMCWLSYWRTISFWCISLASTEYQWAGDNWEAPFLYIKCVAFPVVGSHETVLSGKVLACALSLLPTSGHIRAALCLPVRGGLIGRAFQPIPPSRARRACEKCSD